MERTVVLIKPDAMQKHIVGEIIGRFERAGLRLVGLKMLRLTRPLLEIWYAHHKDKPFFDDLARQMMSTPVVAFVLEGESAIEKVFDICGPTDPADAAPGTIRKDFGESKPKNVLHRSDTAEAAKKEIELLFTKEELFTQ